MNVLDWAVDHLEQAKRYENYVASLCPFHSDHSPSFMIYSDKYRCLSCGAWGDTDQLPIRLGKMPEVIREDKQDFFNPFTRWLQNESLTDFIRFTSQQLAQHPSHYLKQRGIPSEVQIKLKLGMIENWIIFPIFSQDEEIVGAVARAGEGNKSSRRYVIPSKQDPNLLYVPSWARLLNIQRKQVYITFGIIDSISLYQCGVASASTTTGKRIDRSAFDGIRKKIIFVPDSGEEIEANKIAATLGWRGSILNPPYPVGVKDPNDLYQYDKNLLLSVL